MAVLNQQTATYFCPGLPNTETVNPAVLAPRGSDSSLSFLAFLLGFWFWLGLLHHFLLLRTVERTEQRRGGVLEAEVSGQGRLPELSHFLAARLGLTAARRG